MYILLWVSVTIAVYIVSFKDDFTKEHIDKVAPFIILLVAVSLILCTLMSVLGGRK